MDEYYFTVSTSDPGAFDPEPWYLEVCAHYQVIGVRRRPCRPEVEISHFTIGKSLAALLGTGEVLNVQRLEKHLDIEDLTTSILKDWANQEPDY